MRWSLVISSVFALSTSLFVGGCVVDAPEEGASLEIPLVQSSNGALYRLRDATFEVTGPDMAVQTLDGDVDAASVSVPATPGIYSVRLLPGWVLERSADGTTFESLNALLGNQNPQVVHVFADAVQQVVFRFYVREPAGTLTIGFGVVPEPHQLFGTLSFSQATGVLASYAGKTVDYANYFDGAQQRVETEADGTKIRHYTATGIAVEFTSDPIGIFTGVIAPQAAGGSIDMIVRARADGTQQVSGTVLTFTGSPITFGPATVAVGLDANGFPQDAPFSVSAPFTLIGPQSTAGGTTTLNHTLD